jgi:hypothetical protein
MTLKIGFMLLFLALGLLPVTEAMRVIPLVWEF